MVEKAEKQSLKRNYHKQFDMINNSKLFQKHHIKLD